MPRVCQIDDADRIEVNPELERRTMRALGLHVLTRDIMGDGEPWRILLDPDIVEMNWERVRAGTCGLSVSHDDAPLPDAPAQQVHPPVGVVLSVDHEPGEFRAEVAFARSERAAEVARLVGDGVLAGVSPRIGLDEIQVIDQEQRLGLLRKATMVNLSLVASPDDPDLIVLAGGEATMMVDSAGRSAAIGTQIGTGGGSGDAPSDEPPDEEPPDEEPPDEEPPDGGPEKDKDGGGARMERDAEADTGSTILPENEGGGMPEETVTAGEGHPEGGGDAADQQRRTELMTLGVEHNVHPQVVMQAINEGLTRTQLVDKLLSERYGSIQYAPMLGAAKDRRPVRMGRLVAHMMAPQDKAIRESAAVEIAMMSEHDHAEVDFSAYPAGVLAGVGTNTPVFAMPTRESWMRMMEERGDVRMAQASSGVGGAIGTEIAFDMASPYPMDYAVDPILRRCYVREGLSANVMYPVTTGGIGLAFGAEGADAPEGKSTVVPKNLQPKELATSVPITRQALVRTDQWAYENEMATLGVSRREEVVRTILGVNGGANAPSGIKDLAAGAGVDQIRTGLAWADDTDITYRHITDMAAKVSKSKAPWDDRLYVIDVDTFALLASTPRFTYADHGIIEVMRMDGGGLETVAYTAPAVESTLMDADTIYYGHFASINVGFFGAPLVWLDPISSTTEVILRHFELYDVAISRADFLCRLVKA